MGDMIRRLVWFFFVSGAISYAFFIAAGSVIHAQAVDATRAVLARDSLKANVHRLSGMVMVHSTCAELSVRSEQMSHDTYELQFTTWQEPSVTECEVADTPRSFHAIIFAPAVGVHFRASLDGEPLAFGVIQVVERD